MEKVGIMIIKNDDTRKEYDLVEKDGIRFMRVGDELIGLSLLRLELFEIWDIIK